MPLFLAYFFADRVFYTKILALVRWFLLRKAWLKAIQESPLQSLESPLVRWQSRSQAGVQRLGRVCRKIQRNRWNLVLGVLALGAIQLWVSNLTRLGQFVGSHYLLGNSYPQIAPKHAKPHRNS